MKITFEITIEHPVIWPESDEEAEQNISDIIFDGMGFPETLNVFAKVINRC